MHWATRYLGDEWVAGSHDCWGFVRRVYQEQYGIEVPVVAVDALNLRAKIQAFNAHPERGHWLPVDTPQEGDAVLMSLNQQPGHVGIWLAADGGGVLHCVQHQGVIFSGAASLRSHGWNTLGFYHRTPSNKP
jgi:cell wall-associated NlpC family hydrolase